MGSLRSAAVTYAIASSVVRRSARTRSANARAACWASRVASSALAATKVPLRPRVSITPFVSSSR